VDRASVETREGWAREIVDRRRECYDGLIDLRLDGALSWSGEPPLWDALFREFVRRLEQSWDPAVPAAVQFALTPHREDVAAVAAETAWCAIHGRGRYAQSFELRSATETILATVCAAIEPPEAPPDLRSGGAHIHVGLAATGADTAVLELSWGGLAGAADGSFAEPAPEPLRQSITFANA
jgi:hypothetical protein